MISLGHLMKDSVKLGKMDIKLGQVVSNPYARAFAPQIKEGEDDGAQQHQKDGGDHEVHMAHNQLDTIIKAAYELRKKLGDNEKDIPAWIQDHISNAENYITQASSGYYEYKGENVNENAPCWKGYKQVGMKSKNGKQVPNCVPEGVVKEDWADGDDTKNGKKPEEKIEEAGIPKMYIKYMAVQKKVKELEDKQKAMGAKYFAEKDPKRKASMMPDLKKGTAQLAAYRRNLADIEDKYINSLYDEDPNASKAKTAAHKDIHGYGGVYNSDFN